MNLVGKEKVKRTFHSTTYYVNAIKNETLRTDHPQQRDDGQWPIEYRDGLIVTILNNEDVNYVVVCEQYTPNGIDNYLINGIQRITTIVNYRSGQFALGRNIEKPIMKYQVNVLDEDGNVVRDENGNLLHEIKTFDIRGKKYKDLPHELQQIFDEWQLEEVKHLDCSDDEIGYHLRRYNHAKKMVASQNGITFLNKGIASKVKDITKSHTFFKDLGNFKASERNNDTLNRVALETIMSTYFLDDWKSPLKSICTYLNKNMDNSMLENFKNELDSISAVLDDEIAKMFTSKDSFLWLNAYHTFCKMGIEPIRFVEFLKEFKKYIHCKEWNGTTFDDLNKVSTKKKNMIKKKLQLIEECMMEYLHVSKEEIDNKVDSVEEFIADNVGLDVSQIYEDIDFYKESLSDLESIAISKDSKLLDSENELSLLAMVAYSYKEDKDLEDWIEEYAKRNNTYFTNQKKNYLHMRDDFEAFLLKKNGEVA